MLPQRADRSVATARAVAAIWQSGAVRFRDVLRVGVGPSGIPPMAGPDDRDAFVRFVERVEQLGYDALCVGDHLDDRGAPMGLLSAAAMCTERIALATHLLCNELRHVAVLAQDARTVHALSRGRLELGLGVGWLQRDFDRAGVAMAPFRERLDRLAAAVEQLRQDAGGGLPPPPIVIGGGGPAMLATAARLADIVTVNIPLRGSARLADNSVAGGTRALFEERLRLVRDTAAACGRKVDLHVYVHHVHAGPRWHDDARAAAERVGLDVDEYLESPHVLAGDVDRLVHTVTERAQALGVNYFSIPGSNIEELAPVLEAVRP
jgi:probable F420-dependent oxidoreductase